MVTIEISPDDVLDRDRIVGIGERTVRPVVVKSGVFECPGQRRTHVHIEGGCYDTRIPVTVQRGA
jgi:hypothetical protein